MQIFPFFENATEMRDGSLFSPREFYAAYMEAKPEGLSWFGYDVEVRSPTEVTFYVLDMADFARGGRGRVVKQISAKVDQSVTKKAIERRLWTIAVEKRKQELRDAEDRIIAGYADELHRQVFGEAA